MTIRARGLTIGVLAGLAGLVVAGCDRGVPSDQAGWAGTMDTLPSGQVVVTNPASPVWRPGEEWTVELELRIGRVDGDGPDLFGRVFSFEVDGHGRYWVLDSQSQEIRVFDAQGGYVRTVGRRGSGPGELAEAVQVEMGPDGHLWVMDPQNNRVSIFDTAGTYLESKPARGGFIIMPWPGGFDRDGYYYAPFPRFDLAFGAIDLVRHDRDLVPLDTVEMPRDPVERDFFEHRQAGGGVMRAGVPFSGGLASGLSPRGTVWGLLTDQYRLFELSRDGDTLRTITQEFTAEPVTREDRDHAREELTWFTDQGGQVDLSKLPRTKPATGGFFVDDEDNIWVMRVTSRAEAGRIFDIIDPDGRFLGTVRLPFPVSGGPPPIVRDGAIHAITEDELGVQYVVRGRIVR